MRTRSLLCLVAAVLGDSVDAAGSAVQPGPLKASLDVLSPASSPRPTAAGPTTPPRPPPDHSSASSSPTPSAHRRYTPVTATLADGSSQKSGSFNSTLRWQSSGVLQHGGCPTQALIGDCYSMYLSSSGMLEGSKTPNGRRSRRAFFSLYNPYHPDLGLDSPHEYFTDVIDGMSSISVGVPMNRDLERYLQLSTSQSNSCNSQSHAAGKRSARQRIEILSWPPAMASETWEYSWRSFLDDRTRGTEHFFHLFQLLQRSGCGGYVVAEDLLRDAVQLADINRGCAHGPHDCGSAGLDRFRGRTVQHNVRVTYGQSGSFVYTAVDAADGSQVLHYSAVGDMGSSSSIKFGLYRRAVEGMSDAWGYVGDYSGHRVA